MAGWLAVHLLKTVCQKHHFASSLLPAGPQWKVLPVSIGTNLSRKEPSTHPRFPMMEICFLSIRRWNVKTFVNKLKSKLIVGHSNFDPWWWIDQKSSFVFGVGWFFLFGWPVLLYGINHLTPHRQCFSEAPDNYCNCLLIIKALTDRLVVWPVQRSYLSQSACVKLLSLGYTRVYLIHKFNLWMCFRSNWNNRIQFLVISNHVLPTAKV